MQIWQVILTVYLVTVLVMFLGCNMVQGIDLNIGQIVTEQVFNEKWNFLVSIRYNNKHMCSGTSVIQHDWVLTAASCMRPWTSEDYGIQDGEFTVMKYSENNVNNDSVFEVEYVVIHPNYNSEGRTSNDIALVKLILNEKGFKIENAKKIVHLPTLGPYYGEWGPVIMAETAGWGQLFHTDRPETIYDVDELEHDRKYRKQKRPDQNLDLLRTMNVTIEDKTECSSAFYQRYIPYNVFPRSLFCVSVKQFYPKMVCAADHGGPIIHRKGNKYEQIGILSLGECQTYRHYRNPKSYQFATEVIPYLPWIRGTIDRTDEQIMQTWGYLAPTQKFKSLASIRYNDVHKCAGAIIRKFWILTSKRCFLHVEHEPKNMEHWTVRVGDHWDHVGVIYKVDRYIFREITIPDPPKYLQDFKRGYSRNDLALVRLETPIVFNQWVDLAKLPKYGPLTFGENCKAAGWGIAPIHSKLKMEIGILNNDTYKYKTLLKQKWMYVVSLERCREQNHHLFEDSVLDFNVDDTFICTQVRDKEKDICLGEQGAPMFCSGLLWGIASWGNGCVRSTRLELWTRIDKQLAWIFEILGEVKRTWKFGSRAFKPFWPFAVAVERYDQFVCTAVLLSASIAITKASCFEKSKTVKRPIDFNFPLSIRTCPNGDLNTKSGTSYAVNSSAIIYHDGYFTHSRNFSIQDDVVLLGLNTFVNFYEDDAYYINLAYSSPRIGQTCVTASWNTKGPLDRTTNFLMEVEVAIVDIRICINFYGLGELDINYHEFICTEATERGSDNCMLENGAPLVCDERLAGYSAMRYGCRENMLIAPALWTRIDEITYTTYIHWIRAYLPPYIENEAWMIVNVFRNEDQKPEHPKHPKHHKHPEHPEHPEQLEHLEDTTQPEIGTTHPATHPARHSTDNNLATMKSRGEILISVLCNVVVFIIKMWF